ncbi:hypothetical protein DFJ74DRAFT_686272 [Hyaloraphidium curvatum]|nr:hypothetical protein DFJ74DRAFT_686272 [Hyaloraphidium curvatum]
MLADPPSSPSARAAASPRLGGLVGSARRPSEPVAVHTGGTKGFRTVSRACSTQSHAEFAPPSSPGPLPPFTYSFSSPTRLPDVESTAAWKEMGKVVLEEGGKGPRGGWWVEVGSGGFVLRCWTHPNDTPADLKHHLQSLFPSHLECGPASYRLYLLLPREDAEEPDSPVSVELDERKRLGSYIAGEAGGQAVRARMRLVYTGGR